MWKTFIGYINLKEGLKQIQENRGRYLNTRFHQESNCSILYKEDEVFYCEKIKNILYEYCNDVFVENTYDIFFDLTKSQFLLKNMNAKKIIDSLKMKIEAECHITIQIAMSFQKDFAKWIYHHSCEQYRILDCYQAKKFFGRNIYQEARNTMSSSESKSQTLPRIYGEEDQTVFSKYLMAQKIAEKLVNKLVRQLKEKDYGIRRIQIQFYDSKMCLYTREESLRNFTNVYSEIYYIVIKLLKNISYQKTYFGMKILVFDFKDYQIEKNIINRKTTVNLERLNWFQLPFHFSVDNQSLLKKTV